MGWRNSTRMPIIRLTLMAWLGLEFDVILVNKSETVILQAQTFVISEAKI